MDVFLYLLIGVIIGLVVISLAENFESQEKIRRVKESNALRLQQLASINKSLRELELQTDDDLKTNLERRLHQIVINCTKPDLQYLEECIRDIYSFYRNEMPELTIDLKLNITENSVKKWSPLGFLRVLQVIHEALHNAVIHSKATFIFTICTLEDNAHVIIIHDNGIGFQVDQLNTGGLQKMRNTAESLKATLNISSTLGVGSKVTLTL